MMDFILGLIIGKDIEKKKSTPITYNYDTKDTYVMPVRTPMTVYEYWPAFDNDEPTLEIAYKLYNENGICHVNSNGITKCYFEFDGDDGYIKSSPKEYFDRI